MSVLWNTAAQGVPEATIVFLILGKLTYAATFATVYLYASKLFPTPTRSPALGMCSKVARLGLLAAIPPE